MTFRHIAMGFTTTAALLVAGFVGANAVDYLRFHRAIWRLESLTEDQLRALGDAATHIDKFQRTDHPVGFELLQPIKANLWPGSLEFLLYQLKPNQPRYEEDNIYLYARISTSPHNQKIYYFTNSSGKQRTKVIWNRNPAFVQQHSPGNRILSICEWGRDSRTWIILPDRILVVDDNGYVGGEPSIAGQADLSADGLARIKEALAKITPSMRGKDYRAEGVLDGTHLDISFDPDGKPGPDSIRISNTWVEELRPLLTTVSELSPKECPNRFIEQMTTDEQLREYPTTVTTLEERDRLSWSEPNTPWWCVWRKWLN